MNFPLNILYEDEDLIVCHKAAGIATQSKNLRQIDLESQIKSHLAKGAKSRPYLAVIHRLDQPVEGILVFAKSPYAAKELSKQLSSQNFSKHYRAFVSPSPKEASGKLKDYLRKDARANHSSVCRVQDSGARLATLHYQILEKQQKPYFSEVALDSKLSGCELEILLGTGRHHQIRVQLSHAGSPIVGDSKYGGIPYERLLLCAYCLEFVHPRTRKKVCFSLL